MIKRKGLKRVAALFPGAVTDKSWCQFGYEGLLDAAAQCGLEVSYSASVPEEDHLMLFRKYAGEGYDIVLGHGGEFSKAAQQAAEEFPNVQFGVANGHAAGGNLSAMRIAYSQMGYLRGVLASEMTRTGRVAMVSGYKGPTPSKDEDGFKRGVESLGKLVEVAFAYTGDAEDLAKAREEALKLIASGVDVLTHHLDCADAGVIGAAEAQGVYALGLYKDSSPLGPKAVIGSALGSPGTLIYELACQRALTGEIHVLDVNSPNGIGLHMTDLVPVAVQVRLRAVLEKMRSGEIHIEP